MIGIGCIGGLMLSILQEIRSHFLGLQTSFPTVTGTMGTLHDKFVEEEPELGLHPDILVDAMSETPESVVVCEKKDSKTSMTRLDKEELAVWLDHYRLGQLWTRGEIGGTRW